VHPVGSYCTDVLRCTVSRTLNMLFHIGAAEKQIHERRLYANNTD